MGPIHARAVHCLHTDMFLEDTGKPTLLLALPCPLSVFLASLVAMPRNGDCVSEDTSQSSCMTHSVFPIVVIVKVDA